MAYLNKENSLPSNVGRVQKTTWNTSINHYIEKWISSHYNVADDDLKKRHPNLLYETELYGILRHEFPRQTELFEQMAAEFLSLGIFRSTGDSFYTFTSFGLKYLDYLEH